MTDPTRISDDQHNNAPAVPQGWKLVQTPITEEMHVAAVKVLHRAPGLAGLPQRMLDAMLAAAPAHAPAQGEPFGHFRAEPFGWTDCAEDDEGAIALYEHPAHEKHWTENEPVRLPSARTDRVYLAGPMTGIAELNFPAFNQEAERLRAEGLQVLNPADHGIVDGADWADYLRHDIAGLSSCERIHLLRGWTKSKGACLEMTIAKALGMTVTYQVDAEIEHNNAPAVPQGEPVAYIETITGRLCAPLDEHRLKFPMCYEPLCKQGTAPAQEVGLTEAQTTHVRTALQHAWQLGQVYWQQADSNYTSEHKKSDETQQDFEKFCDDTIAALLAKGEK